MGKKYKNWIDMERMTINKEFVLLPEDFKYMDYIIQHKKNIMKAFNLLLHCQDVAWENNFTLLHGTDVKELRKRVLEHDLSKFKEIEFTRYRQYFYPSRSDINEAASSTRGYTKEYFYEDFEKACKHHYKNNKHHPENIQILRKMSKLDIFEMIIDWIAMSIKFNSCPLEYYKNKKQELIYKFGDKINHRFLEDTLFTIKHCINFLDENKINWRD